MPGSARESSPNIARSGTRTRRPLGSTPQAAAPSFLMFSLLASLVLAQQVGSKVARDALFLSQASAAQLPRALLLGAVLSAPLVLGVSVLSTRLGPRRVAAGCLALNAALFTLEFLLFPHAPLATAWLVFLHVVALGGVTLSSFFANVAEYYDPHRAREASVRVTAGAAIGGALGGVGVGLMAAACGYAALLPWLAGLNAICAVVLASGRFWPQAPIKHAGSRSGLALANLGRSRYMRSIAYLVLLTNFSALLLDFNFKRQAAESLGSGAALLHLLTVFHTATALITTLVQLGLARVALERLGLAGTLATLPLGLLLSGALGPLLPRLWNAVGLRGTSSVLESSLFRSAYEPLYTPLSQGARRSLKTLIDVAAGRMGEMLGSLTLLGMAELWPSASGLPVRSVALAAAALALLLSLQMHSRYIAELARSLRRGSVRLDPRDALDSTTRMTLSQTHIELERTRLLAEIAAQRASLPPSAAALSVQPSREPAQAELQLRAAVDDLLSGEPERIRALLARGQLDPRLASLAIPLLEQGPLVEQITAALSGITPRIVGLLTDALHDQTLPAAVRRRLPRILQSSDQPLAAQALAGALRAPERVLRYRAAGALVAMTTAKSRLAPTPDAVFDCVHSELLQTYDTLSLQHVFLLLSLALEREPLWLAYAALSSKDARRRGTALEYLQQHPARLTARATRNMGRAAHCSPLV